MENAKGKFVIKWQNLMHTITNKQNVAQKPTV